MTIYEWQLIFSNRVRDRLEDLNMTQRDLGDSIGVSPVMMSRYMNGQIIPKISTIINIAKILNCSVSDLVDVDEFVGIAK